MRTRYEQYLEGNPSVKKIPFIYNYGLDSGSITHRDMTIMPHRKTNEKLIKSYQQGLDIAEVGRIRGNMRYVEDFWDVQIQPIKFKYAYLDGEGELAMTNNSEMRIRDKYVKIRVVYDGYDYAIINALRTFFTISYA